LLISPCLFSWFLLPCLFSWFLSSCGLAEAIVATGAARAGAALPTSNYFELHFVVQNKGPQTSVVRKFDLEIEGIPGKHENLGPTRRNSIQTRDAQMMLQFASTLEGSSLVVAAHNVWSGILGLQLGALPINSREVRCTLRITDGNASSAHHTFTLPVVG
jgi:hypothetical protein